MIVDSAYDNADYLDLADDETTIHNYLGLELNLKTKFVLQLFHS